MGEMKTKILKIKGDWQDVVDGCRVTVKKPPLGHEPSEKFKRAILIAEHEPIRELEIKWSWRGIAYWIAMHWKTHIWPSRTNTSRTDRTGIDRTKLPQDNPVDFEGRANPQHLIDTWRKRLCRQSAKETREYAEDFKVELRELQTEISDVLVPHCVYRAGCPEMKPCGLWERFRGICDAQGVDIGKSTIQERYDIYNAWFYAERDKNAQG